MKLDKDYLKNLTIIKNTILRDQKNEWVTRFETSLKKKFFFQMSILFPVQLKSLLHKCFDQKTHFSSQ